MDTPRIASERGFNDGPVCRQRVMRVSVDRLWLFDRAIRGKQSMHLIGAADRGTLTAHTAVNLTKARNIFTHDTLSAMLRALNAQTTIIDLAAQQHGVVTRSQLIAAGISADTVDRRLKTGWYRALHRGAYLIGPVLAPRTKEMAAMLACGNSAVVSHRSAAPLWHMPVDESAGPVHVIAPSGRHRDRPGIRVHRVPLDPNEVTTLDGLRLTTPTRTLYDLASTVPQRELERALAEALSRGLTDRVQLERLLVRYERHPGRKRLSALLESDAEPSLTRSAAEEKLLALIGRGKLSRPEVNVSVHGYRVDFFWPSERFVVEVDGYAFHSSQRSFESDRRRDAELAAAGVVVMRVTWQQLTKEPEALLVTLALALAQAR